MFILTDLNLKFDKVNTINLFLQLGLLKLSISNTSGLICVNSINSSKTQPIEKSVNYFLNYHMQIKSLVV